MRSEGVFELVLEAILDLLGFLLPLSQLVLGVQHEIPLQRRCNCIEHVLEVIVLCYPGLAESGYGYCPLSFHDIDVGLLCISVTGFGFEVKMLQLCGCEGAPVAPAAPVTPEASPTPAAPPTPAVLPTSTAPAPAAPSTPAAP